MLTLTSLTEAAKVLRACAGHTPPFVLMKNKVSNTGFSSELLTKIGEGMGQTVVIQELSWARCLHEVQRGQIDIVVDAYEDSERRRIFGYSDPYYALTL